MSYLGTGLSDIKYRIPALPYQGTLNTGQPSSSTMISGRVAAFYIQFSAPSRLHQIVFPVSGPWNGGVDFKFAPVNDYYSDAITASPSLEHIVDASGLISGDNVIVVDQVIPAGDYLLVCRPRGGIGHILSLSARENHPFWLYSQNSAAYDGMTFSQRLVEGTSAPFRGLPFFWMIFQ
ncbi:hypothetical protein [Eilatimonas milleporae]|uniref:hypothetical protein n=1 Tax=Eilatimonas milleporae TaxID=911205 RepID=UPI0011C342A4|nr:hypothetical protein [Eilatimonas milleporae]